jgi:uncharacterized protein
MQWYNEPTKWSSRDDSVVLQANPKTDFWCLTHDGMVRDSGHFYYQRQSGNFLAQVKLSGNYAAMYDQAGLMLRTDEANWIKCGIEYVDGVQQASAVVTRDYSDWSVVPLVSNPPALWLRLQRQEATIEVHYALDGVHYNLLRQAYFPPAETVDVGLMCAAPVGEGFSVTFEGFTSRPL